MRIIANRVQSSFGALVDLVLKRPLLISAAIVLMIAKIMWSYFKTDSKTISDEVIRQGTDAIRDLEENTVLGKQQILDQLKRHDVPEDVVNRFEEYICEEQPNFKAMFEEYWNIFCNRHNEPLRCQ